MDTLGSREVILAPLAASLTATSTVSTDGDAAAASADVALGRMVMTAGPRTIWLRACQRPAKTVWVATTFPPSRATTVASGTMPELSRTATRAATSLPSGPLVTRIATGLAVPAIWTTASALGSDR